MWPIRAGSHTFGKPKDMAKDRLRQKLNPNSNATPQCFSASFFANNDSFVASAPSGI